MTVLLGTLLHIACIIMCFEYPQANYLCVLGVDQTLSLLISEISCSQTFKKANHLENQVRNLILAIISRILAIHKYLYCTSLSWGVCVLLVFITIHRLTIYRLVYWELIKLHLQRHLKTLLIWKTRYPKVNNGLLQLLLSMILFTGWLMDSTIVSFLSNC